jgi:hypothetical protein
LLSAAIIQPDMDTIVKKSSCPLVNPYPMSLFSSYLTKKNFLSLKANRGTVSGEKVNVYLPSLMMKVPDHLYV